MVATAQDVGIFLRALNDGSLLNADEQGNEYWSARDLAKVLEYSEYRHFLPVIERAKEACANSGQTTADHFEDILEMVEIGSGAGRTIDNIKLSRYACYLIVQNADPAKEVVALGQTYFAVQTRIQEISQMDAYKRLSTEDEKRLFLRNEMAKHNIWAIIEFYKSPYKSLILRDRDLADPHPALFRQPRDSLPFTSSLRPSGMHETRARLFFQGSSMPYISRRPPPAFAGASTGKRRIFPLVPDGKYVLISSSSIIHVFKTSTFQEKPARLTGPAISSRIFFPPLIRLTPQICSAAEEKFQSSIPYTGI